MGERKHRWSIDLGPGPQPTDRERELAMRVVQRHNETDGSTAALLTTIAKAFATYRIELSKKAVANG